MQEMSEYFLQKDPNWTFLLQCIAGGIATTMLMFIYGTKFQGEKIFLNEKGEIHHAES